MENKTMKEQLAAFNKLAEDIPQGRWKRDISRKGSQNQSVMLMEDIVEELGGRKVATVSASVWRDRYGKSVVPTADFIAAAPEILTLANQQSALIDQLQAENARLREALTESLALNINYEAVEEKTGHEFTEAPAVIRMATEALSKPPTEPEGI